MSLAAAARVALTTLRDHPLRTALATTGIVIGSASLGGVLSIGDGMQEAALARVALEGYTQLRVTPRLGDEINGVRVPRAQWVAFGESDRAALARAVGPATRVELATQGTVRLSTADAAARPLGAYLLGLSSSAPDSALVGAAHGRALTPAELSSGAPLAMVSDALARSLAGQPAAAVGRVVTVGGAPVTIVGVHPSGSGDVPRLTLPYARATAVLGPGAVTGLRVIAPTVQQLDSVHGRVTGWMARERRAWRDSIDVEAPRRERLADIASAMLAFKLGLGAFAGITLLVGGIGIANVLLSSVHERTREIGIRRAVGARRRDLLAQFLMEAVTITGVGSMSGMALGVVSALAVTWGIRWKTGVPIHAALTPSTILAGVVVSVVVGFLAGLAPALRASRLAPIDAIRQE